MKPPQTRRFLLSDFPGQEDWIEGLFTPLNNFMESTSQLTSNNLTIADNFLGNVQEVRLNRVPTVAIPVPLKWDFTRTAQPKAIIVGNVVKSDYSDFTLSAAVGVQWKYDVNQGLRLVNVMGIVPTTSNNYILTLIVLAG